MRAWRALSQLQDKLLTCYRLDRQPGALLDKLKAARERVEKP